MRAALLTVLLLSGAALEGHEIGTTRISAVLDARGTYSIEIVTDAAALAQKLAAAAGETFPENAGADELQSLLRSHGDTFRRRVAIAYDDAAPAVPAIESAVSPGVGAGASPVAHIRLTGPVPPGAGRFTWNYGWTFATYSFTLQSGSQSPSTQWLEGNQASTPFSLSSSARERFSPWRYLVLGFTHIVPHGLDHMLFVLGIYLLSRRAKTVLYQVSAFTIAHSITLGLSMYGVASLSPRIVEPIIAISIAYVAIENIFLKELTSWRVPMVFAFGLLHGMGFAGALKEVGLPRAEFLTALLSFNVGVEAGQLSVIAAAFLLVGWHCADRAWYRRAVVIPVSAMIACTAVYWTVERLTA